MSNVAGAAGGQRPETSHSGASRPKTPRPKMSMEERAAQFMPFAALTGYYDLIGKTDDAWDAEHIAADFGGNDLERVDLKEGEDADLYSA